MSISTGLHSSLLFRIFNPFLHRKARKSSRPLLLVERLEDRALLATFVVSTNLDDGAGSLRQAIEDANLTPDADQIVFNLDDSELRIEPLTQLPPIINPLTIDGTSQPGFKGVPIITINGSQFPKESYLSGFEIDTKDSTIRGLVINGFTENSGIIVGGDGSTGVSNNRIENCYLGLDDDGTTAVPNASGIFIGRGAQNNTIGGPNGQGNVVSGNLGYGIIVQDQGTTGNLILGNTVGVSADKQTAVKNGKGLLIADTSNNTVGGLTAGTGNLIGGNVDFGIMILGAHATGNLVQGNLIGTNAAGDAALEDGSSTALVLLGDGAHNNTIGGTANGAKNIISGGTGVGILIQNEGTTANLAQGNFIGIGVTGTEDIGIGADGILINNASSNVIGGSGPGEGNIIASAGRHGIQIAGTASKGNVIQGNRIGTSANGQDPLPNQADGIHIIDAAGSVIGGRKPGEGNLIAFNVNAGVVVTGTSAKGNSLLGNLIHSNSASEIDLDEDGGTTDNDERDVDDGPNGLQNFPELSEANSFNGSVTIGGTLNSSKSGKFTLDFYASAANDDNDLGQAQKYLGSLAVTTNSSGTVDFNATLSAQLNVGDVITATATDSQGNTSELSASVETTNEPSFNPVLTLSATPVSYKLKAPAVVLDSSATVTQFSDPGAPTFTNAKLTVKEDTTGLSTETLAIRKLKKAPGVISLSGKKVLFGTVAIATFTGGKGKLPLVVTFNDKATLDAVQAVVRNITYANKAKSATPANRTVVFDITHKDGRTSGPQSKLITFA